MVSKALRKGLLDTDLLNTVEAAKRLRMHPVALSNMRVKSKGPPYVKFGGRVRYPLHMLEEWAAKSLVVPEEEKAA